MANYFLARAAEDGEPLTHLKIQKLVYIAHGWHLAVTGEPLIDEPVQAWKYGPVVPSLYRSLKAFGNGDVPGPITQRTRFGDRPPEVSPSDKKALEILDRVWLKYGIFTGVALSNMTHAKDTPWSETWATSEGARDAVIQDSAIRQHYVDLGRR